MTAPRTAVSQLGIGALSRKTGCKIETIRYYEKRGLLPSPPRTEGGHRVYKLDHVKRLTFIRRSRALGFGIEEIKQMLTLVDEKRFTCQDIHRRTIAHADEVRRKISDLKRLQKVLLEIAANCSDWEVPECPIIDALYEPL
jgi:MerR family mercuric resistance operon transcriptional regulator